MLAEQQLQVFLAYTARFDQIMMKLPVEVRSSDGRSRFDDELDMAKVLSDSDTVHAIIRYINLCSEEFYLHENRLIQDEIWELWSRQMIELFRTAPVSTIWAQVKEGFASDFVGFIQSGIG